MSAIGFAALEVHPCFDFITAVCIPFRGMIVYVDVQLDSFISFSLMCISRYFADVTHMLLS